MNSDCEDYDLYIMNRKYGHIPLKLDPVGTWWYGLGLDQIIEMIYGHGSGSVKLVRLSTWSSEVLGLGRVRTQKTECLGLGQDG